MMFAEIQWPYESTEKTTCPECKTIDTVDARVKWTWDDADLELRCRNPKCRNQWIKTNVEWTLKGKHFQDGERIDEYKA
jgi:hypothetical protein